MKTSGTVLTSLGVLVTLSLLASCSSSVPGVVGEASGAALQVEAEEAALEDTPELGPLDVVEPGGRKNAQVISDSAAAGGRAVRLSSSGSTVTFTVPSTAAGRYSVRVRARAEAYRGQPIVALRRQAQELARLELASASYGVSTLGSFDLNPGERLSVVFLNDAQGGPGQDRNAVIDHLLLDPVGSAAPSPTPAPAPAPTPATGLRLPPSGKVSWDWQIGAGSDADVALAPDVRLVSLDGFDLSAGRVAQLNAQGVYTVCYINVGSFEPWRPDAAQYPASLKVQQDPDWPEEYFLDVTDVFRPNSALAAILSGRFRMCRDKGFAAVEPDNMQNDENVSGGRITLQQQLDFNGWVADLAHGLGLAVFQKNGPDKVLLRDRTGRMMVEKFDGILNEECQQYRECGPLAEYVGRGKLALNVEYRSDLTLDCALSNTLNINSIKKDMALRGGNSSGFLRQTCP